MGPVIRRLSVMAALLLGAVGCGDASDPVGFLLTEETAPALNVDGLPTLPTLVDAALRGGRALSAADRDRLLDALAVWTAAEREGDVASASLARRRAAVAAAPLLGRALGGPGLALFEERLRHWVETALALEGAAPLRTPLLEAQRHLQSAARQRQAGDLAGGARSLVLAGDVVQRTTPESVASRLVGSARASLVKERIAGLSDTDVRRAERLLRGAEEALQAGDHSLAIRRAYYAGRILGAR